jgi:hypothetical protein
MLRKLALPALLIAAFSASLARADDIAAAARKAAAQYQNAVVTLRLTLKTDSGGHSAESKRDTIATMIDPAGLAVTALSNTGNRKSQITAAQFRLPDGTEIPARVVLKDDDLDLAYIAPEMPLSKDDAAKIVTIPLADPATGLQPLDEYFLLARTGKKENFESSVGIGRILGKVTKPRLAYLADEQSPGCPAFDSHGKLIGLCTRPTATNSNPVILPVANITRNLDDAKTEMNKPAPKNEAPASEPATQKKD